MQEHAEIRRFSLIPDVTLHIGLHSVSHFHYGARVELDDDRKHLQEERTRTLLQSLGYRNDELKIHSHQIGV